MRKSLRMLWLPALVLALFAMGCAQTCPPMRHGAFDNDCMQGPQCCAAHAGQNQMQAGCKSMGPGCGKGMAGSKGMGPGCGKQPAGCESMGPGCGQAKAGCKSMAPGCGSVPGAGMQSCGPRLCGTVVAPSEWGPKRSLADYLRGCYITGGRGPDRQCGPDRCGPGPRASCGQSCKQSGPAVPGCASGMNAGRPLRAGVPGNRPMCGKQGGTPPPTAPRHCEQKQ